jgi:putative tryptophan/tyrosine transport system substrate-binding protein
MRRRRTLLTALGATLLAASHRATAQGGKRRVAYLAPPSPASGGHLVAQFTSGLRELGWIEGSNLILDMRWAQGDPARYAPLTNELLALEPDVFVATSDYLLGPAMAATKTVPIVFIQGNNPVAQGVVKSLGRPGGNVTGFATLTVALHPKRLQLLKEAVPRLNKVGLFVNSQDSVGLDTLDDARRILGLEFVPASIERPEDIDAAFEKFAKAGAQGVLDMATGAITFIARDRVAALAIKHRMALCGLPSAADSGMLLSYGYDILALFRRAATLVDRILKGAKPADIPVEQVSVYELVVNLRTARALGLELPRTLMLQATRVIE